MCGGACLVAADTLFGNTRCWRAYKHFLRLVRSSFFFRNIPLQPPAQLALLFVVAGVVVLVLLEVEFVRRIFLPLETMEHWDHVYMRQAELDKEDRTVQVREYHRLLLVRKELRSFCLELRILGLDNRAAHLFALGLNAL